VTHLEVHRRREDRAAQVRVLLEALRGATRPLILGGDFNSSTFERGRWRDALAGAVVLACWPGGLLRRRLQWPDRGRTREPLFDALRDSGLEWERFCDRQPTLDLRLGRLPEARGALASTLPRPIRSWMERRAHLRLDWLAGRGWSAGRGYTVRGLDGPGRASDHAPLVAEFW